MHRSTCPKRSIKAMNAMKKATKTMNAMKKTIKAMNAMNKLTSGRAFTESVLNSSCCNKCDCL